MFRNQEIRQFVLVFIGIAAVSIAVGFAIQPAAGWLALVSAALFGVAFFLFTRARYRQIAQLAEEIDLILHHADKLYIRDLQEGELSILQSEISKMTVRIREQNAALQKEKNHLADSLADIAHQLRTPLTSLNLLLSLMEQTDDQNRRKALLREAETLFAQMDWLLTSLLKLARLDAGIVNFQQESVDVQRLVQTALKPLSIAMELHHVTVQTTLPEGCAVMGDFNWLAEALQNILKNCMENAGEDGIITVCCEDNLLFTELTICDNGAGFAEADLPNLFDRFYRGKNASVAGYGIGLALCKRIITGQGGTITAKNRRQGGAMFVLRFTK